MTTWYELLLRADSEWIPPSVAAVTELNYITTGFNVGADEFDDSLFQLLVYANKQEAGMPEDPLTGERRHMEMFDILQVCCTTHSREGMMFATKSFIAIPPDRLRDFARPGLKVIESESHPDIRIVQVKGIAASGRLPGWQLPRINR